jgi:hypothetical protein
MTPAPPGPFRFMDCALTILSLGRSAQNLRELRDGIAAVTPPSISHHFLEGLLKPAFDDPEYRNDFALWARRHLHDNVLAERLGGIDPMDYEEVEDLRQQTLDVIEDRLAELSYVPSVRPGREFYFLQAHRVILDTGLRAATPAELGAAIRHLPAGSIFYHFIEGRRRSPRHSDDFSTWLEAWGEGSVRGRQQLAAIDFHLWSLTELRVRIARCLRDMPGGKVPS